jgi:BirA family transcriptional regulator, biotin operon repressor / biotin---[acetyl-CoA-carboxylase] ligase
MNDAAAELPGGARLVSLPEIDSTNAEAMRRVLAGERGPVWVTAARQSAGRGRSGRSWASEPGNLFASLIVAAGCPIAKSGQLSLVAGVAATDAIRAAGALPQGAHARIKWPNDILIGAAKAGGILVESSVQGTEASLIAVVGVGVNLASAPRDLGTAATNLAAHGLVLSPHEALCFLAEAMHAWLTVWDHGNGFARVRAAWLERAGPLGETLSVQAGDGRVTGRFAGLDAEGALLIALDDGGERRFTFGDVTLADDAQKEDDNI